MLSWYALTLIALLCYGAQYFLYNVSAKRKCNTAWTTTSFMITVAILSSILFFVQKEHVENFFILLLVSLLNAIFFVGTTITRIEVLKHISISIAYPIIRMSTVFVVLFSLLYFKDKLSIYQGIGIILAILVFSVLAQQDEDEKIVQKNFKQGIALTFVSLLFSAVTSIIVKFAAILTNLLGFITVSYILNIIFSFSLRNRLQGETENPNHKNAVIIGLFIGLVNFIGFYVLLKALAIGPLSVINPTVGLAFVISILLSIILCKEKVTKRRILGILLAIAAVILMGM